MHLCEFAASAERPAWKGEAGVQVHFPSSTNWFEKHYAHSRQPVFTLIALQIVTLSFLLQNSPISSLFSSIFFVSLHSAREQWRFGTFCIFPSVSWFLLKSCYRYGQRRMFFPLKIETSARADNYILERRKWLNNYRCPFRWFSNI